MQLQIPFLKIEATCILTQATVRPSSPESVSVVLDIDMFRQRDFGGNDADLWTFINKLHDAKNEIFEACITDKIREMIN